LCIPLTFSLSLVKVPLSVEGLVRALGGEKITGTGVDVVLGKRRL